MDDGEKRSPRPLLRPNCKRTSFASPRPKAVSRLPVTNQTSNCFKLIFTETVVGKVEILFTSQMILF